MRTFSWLLISAGLGSAQCFQFSAPGVTYTMDVRSVTSGTTSSVLTNLIVSQVSTLVAGGVTYVAPTAPANLVFIDSGGVSSMQVAFNQVLQSPTWGVTVGLTGMLDFLPPGVPAAIPPISNWQVKTPTLGVEIAGVNGNKEVKYTITSIGSCVPGSGGTSAFDLGKELGDLIYQIGCVFCGEPINIATGNLFKQENDYETLGSNRLAFRRYYNSMSSSSPTLATTLGKNWRSNFDRYLNLSTGKVIAERPDGRQITFTQNGAAWVTDTDVDATLANSGSKWTLIDHDDTVETYQVLNPTQALLQTIVARNGYTQALNYNASNQLTSVTDSFQRAVSFTYNNGKLATVATPDGETITFGYDSASTVLTSVTYSTQPATTRRYVYGNLSFAAALTGIIDENGAPFLSWTYDSTGRALTSQHAGGADLTAVVYNDTDGSRTVTNALGQQDIYKFSKLQNVAKVTEVDRLASSTVPAATQKYTYDSNGYVSTRTDWNGNTTAYVNDSRGRPTSMTEASGTAQARTTSIAYHSTLRLPVQIAAPGLTAKFSYDSAGEPLTLTLADTTGGPSNGQTRTWTYTWSNFLLASVKGPRTDVSQLTQFGYDASGALTSITNALGHQIRITSHLPGGWPQTIVDANGVTTNLNYDARQRVISASKITSAGAITTTFTYDAAGNPTGVTLPDGATLANSFDGAHRFTGTKDALGNSVGYVLDAFGSRTQAAAADPGGTTNLKRTGAFDSLGRILKITGGANQATSFAYDANGNLATVTDPLSHATRRFFDALNRVTKLTDAAGGATTIAYDGLSRPIAITDPNGASTSYSYDGFGGILQQSSPASGTTVYRTDSAGNFTQRTDARGVVTNYGYDALNRLISISYPANSAENASFSYDESSHGFGVGRLTSVSDASGASSFSYDERGNRLSETHARQGVTLLTAYSYDAASRITSITYPSKWSVAYSRDAMGRVIALTAISPDGASHPIASSISYQPFGPRNAMSYGNGISETRTFDQDYRLTAISAGAVENFAYRFDSANNVLGITDGVNASSTQSFAYDALNRLTSASGSYGKLAYTYDANGNRLTDNSTDDGLGSVTSLSYNQAGYLASVSNSAQQVTQYSYDAFGRRLAKSGSVSGTTLYQYGPGGRVIEEADASGNAQVDYVYLSGHPIAAIQADGSIYFLHNDRVGTPEVATDGAQSVAWRGSYQPFGRLDNPPALLAQNLRLPGQEFDIETGVYHNGFRNYAPGLGRFLSSDPIGLAAGLNTYAYAANNPLRYIDLLGLCSNVAPEDSLTSETGTDDVWSEQSLSDLLSNDSSSSKSDVFDSVWNELSSLDDAAWNAVSTQYQSLNGFDWGTFVTGLIDGANGTLYNFDELATGWKFAAQEVPIFTALVNTMVDVKNAAAGQGLATFFRDLVSGGAGIGAGIALTGLLTAAGAPAAAVVLIGGAGAAGIQWLINQSGNKALGITPPPEPK